MFTVLLSTCLPLYAQTNDIHHNNVFIAGGAAVPTGSDTAYLAAAPELSFGYGWRFNQLLQADIGLQIAFGAAHNTNPVLTDLGYVQGGDREYMLPIGGRVYLPLRTSHIETAIGGGVIYLHYSETGPSGSGYYGYSINCYTCTSRDGWGGYGLFNLKYYLDEGHTFSLGTTYEFIAGSTHGAAIGNIPANSTTNYWSMVSLDFGVSF